MTATMEPTTTATTATPDSAAMAAIILARLEEYARDDAQRDWQRRRDARRRS